VRYVGALVAVVLIVLCSPAEAKVTCGSGVTAFVDGKLRIFGIHYRTPDEWGFEEYACLGRRRPLLVGGVGSSTGTASGETGVYAHAGRFLADYSQSDGEGGPSAHVTVVDLIRRRAVSFVNVACCEFTPAIRLAPNGAVAVVAPGEGLLVKSPGRRARTLAAAPRDLAMAGGTVYWTEAGQARAERLEGVTGREALMLEPVRMRRRGGACAAAHGRTIAASGTVRVFARSGERFWCRVGGRGPSALTVPVRPRIVGDRWLLVRGEGSARVIDTRTGATVIHEQAVATPTLLRDGTLAWIDHGGRLLVRSPGSATVVLAQAGASNLAAARRAVYWTETGSPRVYRPPSSAARSASKPG
jgi:hypothetical protein